MKAIDSAQKLQKRVTKPPVVTSEVVRNLCKYLLDGYSIEDACMINNISRTAYYDYVRNHPELAIASNIIRKLPVAQAEANLNKAIAAGNLKASMWLLERALPERFNPNFIPRLKISAHFKTEVK